MNDTSYDIARLEEHEVIPAIYFAGQDAPRADGLLGVYEEEEGEGAIRLVFQAEGVSAQLLVLRDRLRARIESLQPKPD